MTEHIDHSVALEALSSVLTDPVVAHKLLDIVSSGGVLVAQQEACDAVRQSVPGAQDVKGLHPDTVWNSGLPENVSQALVLMSRGETGMVKRLRVQSPECQIVAFGADIVGLRGLADPKRRPAYSCVGVDTDYLVLSVPGNDAEYFCSVLEATGYGRPVEWVNPLQGRLAAWQSDFNPLTALGRSEMAYRDGPRRAPLLQADTIVQLQEAKRMKTTRFRSFLRDEGVKVLYLARRDKVESAVLVERFASRFNRSVWSRSGAVPKNPDPLRGAAVAKTIAELIHLEDKLEEWLKPLKHQTKMIYLEELVEQPYAVMSDLKLFLGAPRGEQSDVPDYSQTYQLLPRLKEDAAAVRDDLISMLGLSVNAEGSITTASHALIGDKRVRVQDQT